MKATSSSSRPATGTEHLAEAASHAGDSLDQLAAGIDVQDQRPTRWAHPPFHVKPHESSSLLAARQADPCVA